jgi:hypothetical protein
VIKTKLNLEQEQYEFKPELCQNSLKIVKKSKYDSQGNATLDSGETKPHFEKLID